jgi:hypothetical protein
MSEQPEFPMKRSVMKQVTRLELLGAIAIAVTGAVYLVLPQKAAAFPAYAQKTGYPCGVCHVSPKGGGPLNKFGIKWVTGGMKSKPKK